MRNCQICGCELGRNGRKFCRECKAEGRKRRNAAYQKTEREAEKARARAKAARLKDPEKHRARYRDWHANNREALNARKRSPEARAKHNERVRAWRAANPEEYARRLAKSREKRKTPEGREQSAAYHRNRRARDPQYRISGRMTAGIYAAIKKNKAGRKWESLVGYTLADLVRHLERQFARGMSWANMGEWHIDHIRPKSGFDQTDPFQFRECWALTNLRPLWAPANQAKAARREHLL